MFKQIVPKGKARIQVEPIVDVQLDPTGNTYDLHFIKPLGMKLTSIF